MPTLTDNVPDLADLANGWRVPRTVTGLPRTATIGPCVYSRYPGIFVYMVWGELSAQGLQKDGTWFKYGEAFDSAQEAYEALLASTNPWVDSDSYMNYDTEHSEFLKGVR